MKTLDSTPQPKPCMDHAGRPRRARSLPPDARFVVSWQFEDDTPVAEILQEPPVLNLDPIVADQVARLILRHQGGE